MGVPAGPPQRDPRYSRFEDTFSGDTFDGFESGRHGKADMTAEIRMDRGSGPVPPPPVPSQGFGGPGDYGPPTGEYGPPTGGFGVPRAGGGFGGPGGPGGGPGGPAGGPVSGEAHRVDQLRRTFQPRRFGSGYDPNQVDRFFESIIVSMTQSGTPISDAELDAPRFNLVPGGYFEAEVDAAIREVKDILRRR